MILWTTENFSSIFLYNSQLIICTGYWLMFPGLKTYTATQGLPWWLRGGALLLKVCQVIIQKAWQWTIVGNVFGVCHTPFKDLFWRFMSPPTLVGRYIVFVLSVRLSVTQFVSATPLKLLNRISWNMVGSKDTICSCAYYQEILISWILWELCPFELTNFPKFTTEAACQHNSSETIEQNFMKLGR